MRVELDGAVLVVLHVLRQSQTLHQQGVPHQTDDGPHDERHEQVDVDDVALAVQTPVRSPADQHVFPVSHNVCARNLITTRSISQLT